MNQRTMVYLMVALLSTPLLESKLIHISDENQYNSELNSHKRMLIKFSADWCSVCSGIKKSFEEIADEPEFQQHIAFAQVDVDKLDGISKQNGIVGVPTFVYVENGSKKIEEIGVQNMPAFKDHVRDNLRKTFQIAQNDVDTSLISDQPAAMADDTTAPEPQPEPMPVAEPNIFMRILNGIKDFLMLIVEKIKGFFTTIVDAIKGFFGA
jgi:thiol-disulfide isomerase/thioredoxin